MLNNEEYSIQLWDTAGQERFQSITKSFFRGANGIVICFDLSDRESLTKVNTWLNFSKIEYEEGNIAQILLGTKGDEPIDLDYKQLEKYKTDYQIQYFMTSAKTGLYVEEAFDHLFNQIRFNMNKTKSSIDFGKIPGKTDEEKQKNFHENDDFEPNNSQLKRDRNKNRENMDSSFPECKC